MKNSNQDKYSLVGRRIFVAGHKGMVGSALIRALKSIECDILTQNSNELDLKDTVKVDKWFKENKPDTVFLAAAKVGGILANSSYPASFLYDNLLADSITFSEDFPSGKQIELTLVFNSASSVFLDFSNSLIILFSEIKFNT